MKPEFSVLLKTIYVRNMMKKIKKHSNGTMSFISPSQ